MSPQYTCECVISRLNYLEERFPALSRTLLADIMLAGVSAVAGSSTEEIKAAREALRTEANACIRGTL